MKTKTKKRFHTRRKQGGFKLPNFSNWFTRKNREPERENDQNINNVDGENFVENYSDENLIEDEKPIYEKNNGTSKPLYDDVNLQYNWWPKHLLIKEADLASQQFGHDNDSASNTKYWQACGDDHEIDSAFYLSNGNPEKAQQKLLNLKSGCTIDPSCKLSPQCQKINKYLEQVEKKVQNGKSPLDEQEISCNSKTYFDERFGKELPYLKLLPNEYLNELYNERERCCPKGYFGLRKISKNCRKLKKEINEVKRKNREQPPNIYGWDEYYPPNEYDYNYNYNMYSKPATKKSLWRNMTDWWIRKGGKYRATRRHQRKLK